MEQERQQAAEAATQVGGRGALVKSPTRLGVGIDGAKIHIREEGWKELKVGCLFEVEVRPIFDPDTQEWLEQGHGS